jgi:hypothetical protein
MKPPYVIILEFGGLKVELIELREELRRSFAGSEAELEEILREVAADKAVFPFNEYEHLIGHMLGKDQLTYTRYAEIRAEYVSQNPNLWIYEISAPRGFGEGFAQTYVLGRCPTLAKPSKKLHAAYTGEYDFWLDGIRIEVKASRAVDSESDAPLYVKALARKTGRPFLMNFQQLKPQCCDVFVWVAVFRDEIVLWVMGSREVENHPGYSRGQHRGNSGNEGQLHVRQDNITTLDRYNIGTGDLGEAIRAAVARR